MTLTDKLKKYGFTEEKAKRLIKGMAVDSYQGIYRLNKLNEIIKLESHDLTNEIYYDLKNECETTAERYK